MIRTLLLPNVSLWGCLWQSTLFAVLGLGGSFLLRRRPARAHQVLLLAMIGAVLVPALSGVVRHFHLGLLARQVTVPEFEGRQESRAIEAGAFVATSAAEVPPVPRAPSPAARPEDAGPGTTHVAWRTVALWTWAAASSALLGRLLFAFAVGVRLSRRARPLSNGPLVQAMRLAKARLGVSKDLQIRRDTGVRSPVIWCWGRQPVLLLPEGVSGSGDGTDWVGVIAHELAHWKRRDHVSGLLAELVVCALPWNPFLWLSKRHLVSLTEQACDDWVVASGQPAEDYAESLLGFQPQSRMAFVPAVVHSKKGVAARVRRILNDACGNPRTGTKWALGMTVLVACVAAGFAFAQTRPAEPKAVTTNQEKPTSQSADKPTTAGEKAEQPRYAARTFNAKTSLSVYVQETSESEPGYWGEWYLGQTPSAAPLEIPACWLWSVYAPGPVQDRDALIREIRESGVPGLEWDGVTDSDVSRLVGLTELRYLGLTGNQITDAGLEQLKGLTRLESLRLRGPQVTDAGLGHLRGLTGLRSLNLGGPKLTEAGVEQLIKALPGLRALALPFPYQMTDAKLAHLPSLGKLRKLDLSFRETTDASLARLKDFTTFRELRLDLASSDITDAGLAHLEGSTALRNLDLACTKITDAGLAHLKDVTSLRDLGLIDTKITDAGLAHLKGLTKLRRLQLNFCEITGAGLQYLRDMTELRALELNPGPITDADLQHIEGLTGLRRLLVNGREITDAGLENFKALTRLQVLALWGTHITDGGLEHLKGLTALQGLALGSDRITDAGLEHLKGLTRLEDLFLGGSPITGAGLEHLKNLSQLSSLRLSGCPITDAGLVHIGGMRKLTTLALIHIPITDAGLEHLQGLTALRRLELNDTRVTDAGLRHLKGLTGLGDLDLSGSPVTDAGLESLKGLTGLSVLRLGRTAITGAGLEHLQALPELTFLMLNKTQITDAGLEHIKGLTQLGQLFLRGCPITDAGLEHLKGLTGLGYLNLSDTQVTEAGIQRLKQSLPRLDILRGQAE